MHMLWKAFVDLTFDESELSLNSEETVCIWLTISELIVEERTVLWGF